MLEVKLQPYSFLIHGHCSLYLHVKAFVLTLTSIYGWSYHNICYSAIQYKMDFPSLAKDPKTCQFLASYFLPYRFHILTKGEKKRPKARFAPS